MKKSLFLVAFVLLIALVGCNQRDKARIAQLEAQVDSLNSESQQQSQTINEFFASINEIEQNLTLIRQKEQQIGKEMSNVNADEIEQDERSRITEHIVAINNIMATNRKTIASLNSKLKKSNLQVAEFQKILASTEQKLAQRDSTILELKGNLEHLHFAVDSLSLVMDTLSAEKDRLKETVEQQDEKLNEGWYAIGSKKELIEHEVLNKKGGFLGLQKGKTLKKDFNEDYFTKINISTTNELPLFAGKKGVELITNHPSNSYSLEKNADGIIEKIVILDKDKFWKASRYLVIVIK